MSTHSKRMSLWVALAALLVVPSVIMLPLMMIDEALEILTLRPSDHIALDTIMARFQATIPFTEIVLYALLLWWLWPVVTGVRAATRGLTPTDRARRRLLSAPLTIPTWHILRQVVITPIFMYYANTSGFDLDAAFIARTAVQSLLVYGLFGFVLLNLFVEAVLRRWFLPAFFPEGGLTSERPRATLGLRGRFFIFYLAAGGLPMFVFLAIGMVMNAGGNNVYGRDVMVPLLIIGCVFLVTGTVLSYFIAISYSRPLGKLRASVDRVSAGDFSVRVRAELPDELGHLCEGFNDMAAGLEEKVRIEDAFGRAVDPAVRDRMMDRGASSEGGVSLAGEERDCSVLFCDIRSFTSISEQLSPTRLVELLNRYFGAMKRCITAEGGVVNKYIGDAIMALFGAPQDLPNHATAAVRAALRMKAALGEVNVELATVGLPTLRVGFGIHSGTVVAGTVGAADRFEYTVIGDVVNVASRLEGQTKALGQDIVISAETAQRLAGGVVTEPIGSVRVAGRDQEVELFAVHGPGAGTVLSQGNEPKRSDG